MQLKLPFVLIIPTVLMCSVLWAQETAVPAQSLFNQGKYDEAATQARTMLAAKTVPIEVRDQALNILGHSYYKQKNYQQALSEFRNIVENYPDCKYRGSSMMMMANCQKELNDSFSAIGTYSLVIKTYPNENRSSEARKELSNLYFSLKSNQPELFNKIVSDSEVKAVAPESLMFSATLAYKKQDYDKALICANELISQYSDSKSYPGALLYKAKILGQKSQGLASAQLYGKIIKTWPTDGLSFEARKDLADCYLSSKTTNPETSNQMIADVSVRNILPEALRVAGEATYYKQSDYRKAAIYYQEVFDSFRDYKMADDCVMMLGRCYKKLKDYPTSIDKFRSILTAFPTNNHCNEAQAEIVDILINQEKMGSELRKEAELLNQYSHPKGRFRAMNAITRSYLAENKAELAYQWLKNEIENHPNPAYEQEYKNYLSILEIKSQKAE